MSHDQHGRHHGAPARSTRLTRPAMPAASIDDTAIVGLTDDELRQLGLPPGAILRVDRTRRPANGDLAWVELVPRIAVASLVTATILITWRFVRLTRDRDNAQRILEVEHHIQH